MTFSDKLVEDVTGDRLEVANAKTTVSDCAKKMKSMHIEQVPVVGVEEDLIGLVRATDLIKSLIR